MKPPKPSSRPLPKKRNLAAKALADPAFRPKIVEKPGVQKRKPRFTQKLVDDPDDDQIN